MIEVNDTIAAIATAASEAGIGIIRISGENAFSVADRIFRTPGKHISVSDFPANTIHYGHIYDKEEVVDEVLLSVMKAPRSYTTEDTVEINTHGGTFIMKRVLDLVLSSGARAAEPGEFTKRAFLGGRIDLSEAEAVMDLISSSGEFARKASMAQLSGSVSGKIREYRTQLIYEIAFIESALDDPENYSLDGYPEKLDSICLKLIMDMEKLLSLSESGRIMKNGIRTVIVGKPNVGKSSLLNYILGQDRAIVTEIAGTTRDILEETARIGEVLLHITDTAGIHETSDRVESIGIERARKALSESQLVLCLFNAAESLTEEDLSLIREIRPLMAEGKQCIVLLNKSDLEVKLDQETIISLFESDDLPVITCSVANASGMDELENTILSLFHLGKITETSEVFLTNLRHTEAVRNALSSLRLVRESIAGGLSEDFYAIDLMNAYTFLGTIIGESVEDDLVEEIFSKFCLGK